MTEEKKEVLETTSAEDSVVEENTEPIEKEDVIKDSEENVTISVEETDDNKTDCGFKSRGLLVAVVCGVVTALLFFAILLFNPFKMKSVESIQKKLNIGNPHSYSDDYIDTTGRTVGDVAEEMGMEVREFLVNYGLPEDMDESVHEHAALSYIPVKIYAEKQLELKFEDAKEIYGWGDDITGNMPIGEAIDKTTLAKLYGESLEVMKVQFGLDETVTGDTLYGEVRETVETKIKAAREAQEAEAAAAAEAEVQPAENAVVDENAEETVE